MTAETLKHQTTTETGGLPVELKRLVMYFFIPFAAYSLGVFGGYERGHKEGVAQSLAKQAEDFPKLAEAIKKTMCP